MNNFLKITILRSPVKNFESIFSYFQPVNSAFLAAGTVEKFIQSPEQYVRDSEKHEMAVFARKLKILS